MLFEFAQWCEASGLGKMIRNSQYAFPIVEFFHLAALAVIGGAVLVVDMRLLGLGLKKTSVAQPAEDARPWMTGSLIVMLVSGIALYSSEATKCYQSPAFWIKMISLLLAMIFTYTITRRTAAGSRRSPAGRSERRRWRCGSWWPGAAAGSGSAGRPSQTWSAS